MKNNKGAVEGILWIIMLTPILYFAAVYSGLPDTVATHFDANGVADAYSDKSSLWILVTGFPIGLYALMKFAPTFDPKGNLKKYDNSYSKLRVIIQLFIAAVVLIIVLNADGVIENTAYAITFAFAFLITMLGNYLQTVKPNYFVGFRTPWTLESEEVWRKTHRLIGRVFFFSGIICALVMAFIPQHYAIKLIVALTLGGTLYGSVYSYLLFTRIEKQKT